MLAGAANISRSAYIVAAHMIASLVAVNHIRASLFATKTIEALGAWLTAIIAGPALAADAFASLRVTR